MKSITLILAGPGNVGTAFMQQFDHVRETLEKRFEVALKLKHVLSSSQLYSSNSHIDSLDGMSATSFTSEDILSIILEESDPLIFIDTTSTEATLPYLKTVLEKGGSCVMANKKNIAAGYETFQNLYVKYQDRMFIETTVGAGLPVISTVNELTATGDEIVSIQGCFSGTLGYIFSELERGEALSNIVVKAKDQGFTEPDPRDDLSGVDVARKALILSRLMGMKTAIDDISIEALYPDSFSSFTVNDFMDHVPELDKQMQKRVQQSQENANVLRYVATITRDNINVGVEEVMQTSDIGALSGPDNIVVITSQRYNENPLIIKGPGAGVEVTAAGVLGDVIKSLRVLS